MDTNKLTTKSRDAVSSALRLALTGGNPYVEPSHLLHALLMVPGNTVAPLITAVGADPAVVDAAAQGAISKLSSASGASVAQPQLSGGFARVLADAETRAENLGDSYVATEHLLIALAVVVVLGLGVGAFFLFRGDGSGTTTSAQKTAFRKVLDASRNGTVASQTALFCAADITAGIPKEIADGNQVSSYTLGDVHAAGTDRATVEATVVANGKTNHHDYAVRKESGVWKACFTDNHFDSSSSGGSSTSASGGVAPGGASSASIPSSIPSIPSLPSDPAGSSSTTLGACRPFPGTVTTAGLLVALDYMFSESATDAEACVYQGAVPSSTTEQITDSDCFWTANPPPASQHGPVFTFDCPAKQLYAAVTITAEPDGRLYVTKVVVS